MSNEQDTRMPYADIRVAVMPAQLLSRNSPPRWDGGVGYFAEGRIQRYLAFQGPYAEAGYYFLSTNTGWGQLRFGSRLALELPLASRFHHGVGFGTTLTLESELTRLFRTGFLDRQRYREWETQTTSDSMIGGMAYGQGALGLFVSAGNRWGLDEPVLTLLAGISGRLPFILGVVCCATAAPSANAKPEP